MIMYKPQLIKNSTLKKFGFGIMVCSLLPLGGCISLLPKPGKPPMLAPMVSDYTVEEFAEPTSYTLAVDLPDMPRAIGGYQVVALTEKGTYAYISGLRMATPAPNAVQNILIGTFEKAKAFKAVVRGNTPIRTDFELAIDVPRYEVTTPKWRKDGVARIDISVRIIDATTRVPLAAKTFTATADAQKGDAIEAANALERATNVVSVEIMNWVRDTAKQPTLTY